MAHRWRLERNLSQFPYEYVSKSQNNHKSILNGSHKHMLYEYPKNTLLGQSNNDVGMQTGHKNKRT